MGTSNSIRKTDRIFITGHRGLLGRAVYDALKNAGYTDLITVPKNELDLTNQEATEFFIKDLKPQAVIHCAALVGGIQANTARPAEFYRINAALQTNVIHGAHLADVQNLIFFGSNCMYPTAASQPMPEESLLQGPIEPSNLAYGAAKLSGYVQCKSYHQQYGRNYFTVIPASLYGPHDNYDLQQCHVTPALLLRFHLAQKKKDPTFTIWGTGKPRRELLFSEDAAVGVQLLLENWSASMGPVNLGAGEDLSVREIAETIATVVNYQGDLVQDTSKPDGNMRKLLDSSRINSIGFKAQTTLQQGLKKTYQWLLSGASVRGVKPGEL